MYIKYARNGNNAPSFRPINVFLPANKRGNVYSVRKYTFPRGEMTLCINRLMSVVVIVCLVSLVAAFVAHL